MRLITVFNLPVILLALAVGAAAALSGGAQGNGPYPKSRMFTICAFYVIFLV